MFAFALATGVRLGELCALDVSDINREDKYISINKSAGRRVDKYSGEASIKVGSTKTKNSIRKIPLLPSVEVILDRQTQLVEELQGKAGPVWEENTLVFPTDRGRIHDASGMRTSLGRILKRAGLPHITIHALRHTYATTALNSGVAAQNVAKLLGHKDGATTLKFYAHYIDAEAITQLEKLESQNMSRLGVTANELHRVATGVSGPIEKSSVSELINTAIANAKNQTPKKSVDMVLNTCNDILCQGADRLSSSDKETLLTTLMQYAAMKKQLSERGKTKKTRSGIER